MIVEPAVLEEELIHSDEEYQPVKDQLQSWKLHDLGMYTQKHGCKCRSIGD